MRWRSEIPEYQTTLRAPFTLDGPGLHSGVPCRIDVRPAAPDTGLVFVSGSTRIPALAEYVVETARATVLGKDGVTISTVEHLLAGLFGCGVSNAEIHVDGPEIPVMDGSSKIFTDAIEAAGIVAQAEVRARYVPVAPFFVRDGDRAVIVLPAAQLRVRFLADFAPPIGTQFFDGEITPAVFAQEIASARTFGYLHEVEALRKRGLAQGGTLENALVFAPDGPMQPMRWENEPVRHKVLDLLGDFALLGAYPQCEIVALKSGHKLHCVATGEIRKTFKSGAPSAQVR
ncbi:MAG TPA: UDP-3-O-acyl-N-acetylglucosamine deacetylase [Candidatus Baltobacteraceae bacterium]|nr:UDP-3-O-acyl-N-acetylglucosamine deacetylase [Candidatus Baltobacteraceae bacterium]